MDVCFEIDGHKARPSVAGEQASGLQRLELVAR